MWIREIELNLFHMHNTPSICLIKKIAINKPVEGSIVLLSISIQSYCWPTRFELEVSSIVNCDKEMVSSSSIPLLHEPATPLIITPQSLVIVIQIFVVPNTVLHVLLAISISFPPLQNQLVNPTTPHLKKLESNQFPTLPNGKDSHKAFTSHTSCELLNLLLIPNSVPNWLKYVFGWTFSNFILNKLSFIKSLFD